MNEYLQRSGSGLFQAVGELTLSGLFRSSRCRGDLSIDDLSPGSELVAELAQQALSRLDVGFGFDTLAPRSIHDAENPAPAPGVSHDDFRRIGRRTVDDANLRHRLDGIQNVDRESAGHEDDEGMSATKRQGVPLRQFDELRVVP